MSEVSTSSSKRIPHPQKKISNHQLDIMREHGVSEDIIKSMVESGDAVGRSRTSNRRGWMLDNEPVYPSLSFKGLNGRVATTEMEDFRSKYYELLSENVDVVDTTDIDSDSKDVN